MLASAEDKARWTLIDVTTTLTEATAAGAGLSSSPDPAAVVQPAQLPVRSMQTSDTAWLKPARPLLPPQRPNDDSGLEIICHECQAVVLASDDACSQCGLKRADTDQCSVPSSSAAASTGTQCEPAMAVDQCNQVVQNVPTTAPLQLASVTTSRAAGATTMPTRAPRRMPSTSPGPHPACAAPPKKRQRRAKRTSLWATDPMPPGPAVDGARTVASEDGPGVGAAEASHLPPEPCPDPWGEGLPWHGGTFAPPPPPLPVEVSHRSPSKTVRKRCKRTPKGHIHVPRRSGQKVMGKFQAIRSHFGSSSSNRFRSTRKSAHACTVHAAPVCSCSNSSLRMPAQLHASSAATVELDMSTCATKQTLAVNDASDRRECVLSIPHAPTPPVLSRLPSKAEDRMQQLLSRVRAKERRGS